MPHFPNYLLGAHQPLPCKLQARGTMLATVRAFGMTLPTRQRRFAPSIMVSLPTITITSLEQANIDPWLCMYD